MKILHNSKGYYIQDQKGIIHAQNIPNKIMANKFYNEINSAIAGLT